MSELPEEPGCFPCHCVPMVTHIDHLGRGRTLQIHVREVSKLKGEDRSGKREEDEFDCVAVCAVCGGQVVFELMILLLLGPGITDPCYHFLTF